MSSNHVLHVRRNTRFCQRGKELQRQSKIDLVCHAGVSRSSTTHEPTTTTTCRVHCVAGLNCTCQLALAYSIGQPQVLVSSPMPWCSSPDCQAAQDDIKLQIKARGWDRLSLSSSKVEKSIVLLRGGSLFPILCTHIQMLTKAPMHGSSSSES